MTAVVGLVSRRKEENESENRELKHKCTLRLVQAAFILSNILAKNEVLLPALGESGGVEDVA